MKYIFLLLCLVVGSSPGCSQRSKNQVKIGIVLPLTGAQASFGQAALRGIRLAEKKLDGTLPGGKTVQLVVLDDQSKPEEAALAATRLIAQDHVAALIGEIASSRSLAMAPIAQKNGIPMISPGSTNPRVTEVGDFIFRVCFIDPFQGEIMANFAYNQLKLRKVAILKDIKSDYSIGLAEFFAATFKKAGGEIVSEQSYGTGDLDFNSQLTSVRGKKPDGLFVPGSYMEVGLIARQARALGITVPLLGGDDWDSPKLLEIGGKSIEGGYFSNHFSDQDQSVGVQDFVKEYHQAYGDRPDALSVMGNDALQMLGDAIRRAGSSEPKDIQKVLAETKGFRGIAGPISLDANRNAVKSAVVLQVANGQFKFVTAFQPF